MQNTEYSFETTRNSTLTGLSHFHCRIHIVMFYLIILRFYEKFVFTFIVAHNHKNQGLAISIEFNLLQTICMYMILTWFVVLYQSWSFLLDIWRSIWHRTKWLERTAENQYVFFEKRILDWRPGFAKERNCYNCFKHIDVYNCIKQN